MNRMWIGAGLLALLLTAGVLAGETLESEIRPGARQLRQAAAAAVSGNPEKAEALTETVRADWEEIRWLAELLAARDDLEQIELEFEQLSFLTDGAGPAFAERCAALAQKLEALADAHSCGWEFLS